MDQNPKIYRNINERTNKQTKGQQKYKFSA